MEKKDETDKKESSGNSSENQSNHTQVKSEGEIKSGEFMLSVIQKEYENESERVRSLETRTGIFLTFSAALLAFVASTLKLPNLYSVKVTNAFEALPYVLVWFFAVLTLISLLTSIVFFVMVVSVQTYQRLSLDGFDQKNAIHDKEIIAMAMMKEYKIIIESNHEVNNNKIKRYKYGIYLILIALVFTVVSYIFSLAIK